MQSHTLQSLTSCTGWFGLPVASAHAYSKLSRHSDGHKRLVVIHVSGIPTNFVQVGVQQIQLKT
jgi:hypothetical protein